MTAAGLSRELLQDALPLYPGLPLAQITLVASVTQLAVAATQLLAADALGFDSESKPSASAGALVQPVDEKCGQAAAEQHTEKKLNPALPATIGRLASSILDCRCRHGLQGLCQL